MNSNIRKYIYTGMLKIHNLKPSTHQCYYREAIITVQRNKYMYKYDKSNAGSISGILTNWKIF